MSNEIKLYDLVHEASQKWRESIRSNRSAAALRWYEEALLTGTTKDVLAADCEVDEAIKEEDHA